MTILKKHNKHRMIKMLIIPVLSILFFIIIANTVNKDPGITLHSDSYENPDPSLINTINDGNIKYTQFLETNKDLIVKDYRQEFVASQYFNDDPSKYAINNDAYGYTKGAIALQSKDILKIKLSVTKKGLYTLAFDYYLLSDTIVDTECELKVNGDTQYYETKQLTFAKEWISEEEGFSKDRYGNEIPPTSTSLQTWYEHRCLNDGSSLNSGAMYILLDEGENELTFEIKSGKVLLGSIYVESKETYLTYREYLAKYQNASKYSGDLLKLGAENIASKSSLDVRVYAIQSKAASRYETNHKLLNAVYAQSWDNGNQSITYDINAPSAGLYTISFKYLQDAFLDMPTNRTIMINGEVPYEDLYAYPFYFTKKWKNETLHNQDGNLYVYLKEGVNKLTLSVNLDIYRKAVETIDRIMDEMSDVALQIKALTNGQSDKYREWEITKYIPTLKDDLNRWIDEIGALRDYLKGFSNTNKYSSTFSNLVLAQKKLKKLASDPDQIPNNMTSFTDGSASVSQVLGNLILTFNSNPLGLEQIYIGSASESIKLPKPSSNIFVNFFEGMKRFINSFFSKEYSVNSAKDGELEIWVNRSRQYVEIMQQMADMANLKVKFSIMPDQNKLILANSSGDLPDIALGISNWIPYDLALRGRTVDLRQFDTYEDVIKRFAKGSLIPYAYEDGMYGIPETQDFWITFYRSDIYDSLNINCPSTWDELISQLPILQRLGYNFYSPLSSYRGLKPYVATLSTFYQFGACNKYGNTFTGSLYADDGMTTTLSDESNVEALKFMTNLFSIYDVPEETLSFYNSFRYGTLPVGIANSATYTQLLIAAPEINGNWSVALHLGLEDTLGDVVRYAPSGSQGITMFKSSKLQQEGWDFIDWWTSEKTQSEFVQRLYGMYGLEYLWYTANLDSFKTLPIDENDKEIIIEQLESWSMEASRIPAAYMLERSISDAYSRVVFNGENVRIALNQAVIESNREILRKMTEFNYAKDGKKVKDYIVPNVYNIDNWLTRKGGK